MKNLQEREVGVVAEHQKEEETTETAEIVTEIVIETGTVTGIEIGKEMTVDVQEAEAGIGKDLQPSRERKLKSKTKGS